MKKNILFVIFISLGFVLYSETSFAGVQQGNTEFGVFGSISSTSIDEIDDPIKTTILNLNVGHFITDVIQVGGNYTASLTEFSGSENKTTSLYLFGKYHFMTMQTWVPYLGLQLGSANSTTDFEGESSSDSAISYGWMGGVKYFISENVSLNGEYNYIKAKFDFGDGDVSLTNSALLFGVSYYFGKTAQSSN